MTRVKPSLLAGVSCVSAATLCLEISLTRYFSISQNYHFAFLVISLAFLGYGASGTFLTVLGEKAKGLQEYLLSLSSLLFSLTVLASFLVSNALPFDIYRLPWESKQILYIFPYYAVLSIPFFFAGLTISFALSRLAQAAHAVYFSDLLGAGAGSLLAAFVFFPHGERGVFVIISLLALVGSLFFSLRRRAFFLGLLVILFLAEGLVFVVSPPWLNFHISPFKALPQALRYPQARRCLTRWNASSRVDIVQSPAVRFAPGLSLLYGAKLPPQLGLSVDGGELSAVTQSLKPDDPAMAFLSFLPSSLPYFLLPWPKVMILEPKGGLDVQAALAFKATSIKVVESNPLLAGLLRRELASFCGNFYAQENVNLVTAQARAALKAEKENYDLIVFSLTDVFGAGGTGLYGLGENYLYTSESFSHLLDLLAPSGLISMTLYLLPPPRQEAKALATWVEALEKKHLDPAACLASLRTWGTLSLFIKKGPFLAPEIETLKAFCRERLFDTVYYPGIAKEELNVHNQMDNPVYEELLAQLISPGPRERLSRSYLFEIEPASDNRPFFFNFFKGKKARATYEALGRNPALLFQGVFLLAFLLAQACLLAFLLVIAPLLARRRDITRRRAPAGVFFYFALLGAGFIFIEIIFIQKFILFLGHPLYSVSTVVFALLFSSGMGSLFSRPLLGSKPGRRLKASLCLCAALALAYLILLPAFTGRLIGLPLGLKIFLTMVVIFPLGFFMGFPFPTGIRLLQKSDAGLIPWAWSANAFSSVIHSILAPLVALSGGYNLVLALAAGAYLAALLFLRFADHGNKADA